MKKRVLLGLIVFALVLAAAIWQRHRILVPLATTGEPVPRLLEASPVEGATLFGEEAYFAVVQLDEKTFAIAEPFSSGHNFNYLILGEQRALLFDAGVGHYDIRSVVSALTDLPVTFMPSHFHYDHTGQGAWERVAIVDVPHIRERAKGDELTPSWGQHLGSAEGIPLPTWTVSEWVAPNSSIDLGGRELVLLYTPGHTDNSVSLYDMSREVMFTGDFFTASGRMNAFTPTASLGDILQSANRVLAATQAQPDIDFRGAHANTNNDIPVLGRGDLSTLIEQLKLIKAGKLKGEGVYPVVYMISADMNLLTEPRWLQDWSPTYPDDHPVHSGLSEN